MFTQKSLTYIAVFFHLAGNAFAQGSCSNGSIWGQDLAVDRNNYAVPCIEEYCKSFLVFSRPAGCYGKIREWRFVHSTVCHDVLFQVYRPTSTGSKNYTLIGENLFPFIENSNECSLSGVGSKNESTFKIPKELQIPVHPDDLISWQDINFPLAANTSQRLFMHEEGNSGSQQFDVIYMLDEWNSCHTIGQSCPWDESYGKVSVAGRQYSLNAEYQEGDPPIFENLKADAQVAEHQPPGRFVYKAIASNNRNWNPVIPVNITYSITQIVENSGSDVTDQQPFVINKTTGEIFTNKELDHESLVEYFLDEREAYYRLTIAATQQENGPNDTGILDVHVYDVNERHDINNLPTTVVINTEITNDGDLIYNVNHEELTHEDFNTCDNETQWPEKLYTMVNTDPAVDIFYINRNGNVYTSRNLTDWQGPNTTDLYITCHDEYYTTSPKILTVVLSNLWQPPHLENLPNTVSVPENVRNMNQLYKVTSSDESRGNHRYSIIAVYPPTVNPPTGTDPFHIGNSNGVVSISNAAFDYRTVQKYEVEITARDDLYHSKPENLTVEITFVNKRPYWEEENYEGAISELTPIGSVIPGIHLKSNDPDIPIGDWTDYVINGTGSYIFHADNVTHRIFVVEEYNLRCKKEKETFNLQITVIDSFGAYDTSNLSITITDINNNMPKFNANFYEGTVNELWVGGTAVEGIMVTVTDCDSNAKYGRVDIVVVEDYARKYFEVKPFNCETDCTQPILLKQPISYSDYPNITFTLLASDTAAGDTAVVFIDIVDENDHPPEFVNDFYDMEERDDVPTGTTVTTLITSDPDSEANSNTTYFLLIPDEHFVVEGGTGAVKSRKHLPSYYMHLLYAYARDHANPELFSDPSIVRIDTYPPKKHLVDIHMHLPLEELIIEEFLADLNKHIHPWVAIQEDSLVNMDRSILTIYALSEAKPTTQDNLFYDKKFVPVDDLLGVLRINIKGTPMDWLRGSDFSEYQVYRVEPTYPNWLVDTIPGILTLTLLCVVLLLLLLVVTYKIYKQHSKNKISPDSQQRERPPSYNNQEFDLRYAGKHHAPRKRREPQDDPFVTSASGKVPWDDAYDLSKPTKYKPIPRVTSAAENIDVDSVITEQWEDTILPGTPMSDVHF